MTDLVSTGPARDASQISLRIMATTDVHMHILPFDYTSNLPTVTTGLARTASLIHAARAGADNALLFDNGDFLNGTPMGDAVLRRLMEGRHEPRGRHPVIAAMRKLGVDAITLGNHDFDHGIGYLAQVLAGTPFPVVTSNLRLVSKAEPPAPAIAASTQPFALIDREMTDHAGKRHRIKVGLLGFMPPGSITGLRHSAYRAEIHDIVTTARIMVPQLRALGADLVVVLAHSGIGLSRHFKGMENALVPLARVPGIDAIIGGHRHQTFPDGSGDWPAGVDPNTGRIHGTPVVVPGFWGSHLGVIDLSLAPRARGGWEVAQADVELRPISIRNAKTGEITPQVEPDPAILKLLNRLHSRIVALSRQTRGETRQRLHSYFATVVPSPALDIVHRAQAWYVTRALAGSPLQHLPVIPAAAPFKAGGLGGPGYYTDIAVGPITEHGISDLYLYPNDLCAIRMTGAELADWLERATSIFNRIVPNGGEQVLLGNDHPVYTYETLAGCDYEIDLSAPPRFAADGTLAAPAARRVRNLSIHGRPISPDEGVLLVTSSFRSVGGGGYPKVDPAKIVLDTGRKVRDVIAEYLGATGPVDGAPWASWRFTPIPGASALFVSAPEAIELLGPGPTRAIHPGPVGPDGFRAYRLALGDGVSYMAG